LAERHEKEQLDFHSYWSDSKSLLEFSKPSPQLLQLRTIQHKLALINDFGRAATIRNTADRLEGQETAAAQLRAQRTMEAEARRLVQRQAEERAVLAAWKGRQERCAEAKRDLVIGRIERAREFSLDEVLDLRGRTKSEIGRASYRGSLCDQRTESRFSAPPTLRRHLETRLDLGVGALGIRGLDPKAALEKAGKRRAEKPAAPKKKEPDDF
jgi:hypothetical protein